VEASECRSGGEAAPGGPFQRLLPLLIRISQPKLASRQRSLTPRPQCCYFAACQLSDIDV